MATTTSEPMLICASAAGDDAPHVPISRIRVLKVLGRRSLPSLIEATIIPAILLYIFFAMFGPVVAMLSVLAWSYGAVLRRVVSGQPIPGVLLLAVTALTVRTIVGIASGTFLYFLQPVATTLVLAGIFVGSMFFGRPIIARMAGDFCPISADIAERPAIVRLFAGLTLMWAGVHFLSAVTTFAMLTSLPTETFIAVKSFVSLGITISAVAITIHWSIRTARAENLIFVHTYV
jgi:intracellular septation protein A